MNQSLFFTIVSIIFVGAFFQLLQTRGRLHDYNVKSKVSGNHEPFEETEYRMELKRTILKRGCSMVKSLYEMSTNETSFEELFKWHQRIENISFPITNDGKDCFPSFLDDKTPLAMYQIHTENSRLINKSAS